MNKSNHTKPFVIGISGGSGSGKTSFVRDLVQQTPNKSVAVLTMDNYYIKREEQINDENGVKNFDLPTSINIPEYKRDLQLLIQGNAVSRVEYTFNNDEAVANEIHIESAPFLITEGLFVYSDPEIFEQIDLSIIINVKDVVKLIRRIKRDKTERNYPLEDVVYRYENHVLPSFERYILPYFDEVDLIINNNRNYKQALALLVNFIGSGKA